VPIPLAVICGLCDLKLLGTCC